MSLRRYDALFESFLINIALTKTQSNKINAVLGETLSLFLTKYEGDVDIYAQGSYAMGTTVRPLTANQSPSGEAGEYDIDIVLERSSWTGAKQTLLEVRELLTDEYGQLVDQKNRETCERVNHDVDDNTEVGFHVDYVPIKTDGGRKAAKRSADYWFASDTKKLVEWFSEYAEQNTFLPASLLTLKRMRDFAGLTDDMPSICITALVCNNYKEHESYAADLLHLLGCIVSELSVPYEQLSIQIDPISENLAKKLTRENHARLSTFFRKALDELKVAFEEADTEKIRSYLSNAFPQDMSKYPELLESLRNRSIGIELDGSLSVVNITEEHGKGRHIKNNFRRFLGVGDKLIFRANLKDKSLFGIRWQVLNSAQSPSGERRGNLFKARGASGGDGSSTNRFVNHETEQYEGEHWIKYYTYNKSTKRVEEIGRKFYVDVEKKNS